MSGPAGSAEAGSTPRFTLLIATACIALVAFIAVGALIRGHPVTRFDDAVRAETLSIGSPAGTALFTFVTTVGSVTPMIIYGIVAICLVSLLRRSPIPLSAAIGPAAAVPAYLGMKSIFLRARPSGVGNAFEGTYSYPSAHATTSAVVCCTLGYLLWRERWVTRQLAMVIAVAPPFLIGASRVYLDVHWATDVLGGWSLGLALAALAAAIYEMAGGAARQKCRPEYQA